MVRSKLMSENCFLNETIALPIETNLCKNTLKKRIIYNTNKNAEIKPC